MSFLNDDLSGLRDKGGFVSILKGANPMKKIYEKPVLTKRDRLGSVTAGIIVVSGPA